MTTPTHGVQPAGAPPRMTPERWRAVDAILQAALAYAPERRNAVVSGACGEDENLRVEVASLLAAHVDAADEFLERPAAEALGAPDAPLAAPISAPSAPLLAPPADAERRTAVEGSRPSATSRGRMVPARAALYAAIATLAAGLTGGLLIGRSDLFREIRDDAQAVGRPAVAAGGANPLAAPAGGSLTVVDRAGRPLQEIPADRPWTPRFAPDGRRVAYGAFGAGRQTSDLWVTDLDDGTTQRLTDDDADANDPQWSPDGATLAYSARAPGGKDLVLRPVAGGRKRVIASRNGTQFPSDWVRDGSALLVTEEARAGGHDILVQPAQGSAARPYAATAADEKTARISPDGRWVAYTSDESGRAEVYLDSYSRPGRRVLVSSGGGVDPVWRGDALELYYWRDGALVAVPLGPAVGGAPPPRGEQKELFRARYQIDGSTMYDVSPDGKRFVLARQP